MTAPPLDIAIPSTPEGIVDTLSDPKKLQVIVAAGPSSMQAFGANVAAEFAKSKAAPVVAEDIDTQVQQSVLKMFRDQGGAGEVKRVNLGSSEWNAAQGRYASFKKGTAYNRHAVGAGQDTLFESTTDFVRAIWHKNPDPDAEGRRQKIRNSYSSAVPADGGFLIPETLRSNLLQVALEQSVVRPRATVIPMDSLRVPFPVLDSTTNAGSVFGGLIAYWTEEGASLTESQMRFGKVVLEAQKLTGFSAVPNELLADSIISLAALIEEKWPQAIAWFEDLAFISGTGVGEPLGFLNNPATVAVAKETNQPAATVVWENILNMYARMLPSSLSRAVWLYNPAAFKELGTMALSVGTGGSPVWINNGVSGPPLTILGRPAMPCEKLAALGTQGDLVFADLSYYMVGDRQAMQAETSTEYLFGSDKTAFRIIQRVDGRSWIQSAITPANSGPTLSPFVELATRA